MGLPELAAQSSYLDDAANYRPPKLAEQVANDFLFSYDNRSTRKNYADALKAWFRWCIAQDMDPLLGRGPDNPIRRADIERYLRWCEEVDGKARRTVAGRCCGVKGFFKRARSDGHITDNPCIDVKSPRVERKTSTNDIARVEFVAMLKLAKAKRPRDYAMLCLLGFNGLRVSELVGIDVRHVTVDRGYPVVQVHRKGGHTQTLALSQVTAHAVSELIGERTEGPLFLSMRNPANGIGVHDVQALVKRYAKWIGMKRRVSPHSFRHMFITQSLNAGVSQRDVQWSAGHADPRMTSYYDHGSSNRASESTHKLTAFIAEMF